MPRSLPARDLVLLLASLALWRADALLRGEPGALPIGVALLAGALGALCTYVAHEWGHLLGARASGSVVHFPQRATSVFLFYFDTGANSRGQFLAMSLGGFAATAVVTPLLVVALPSGALSTSIALTLVAAGVIATLVTELPPFVRVLRGAPLPRGFVYRSDAGSEGPRSAW